MPFRAYIRLFFFFFPVVVVWDRSEVLCFWASRTHDKRELLTWFFTPLWYTSPSVKFNGESSVVIPSRIFAFLLFRHFVFPSQLLTCHLIRGLS
jgi:hypothetical protein